MLFMMLAACTEGTAVYGIPELLESSRFLTDANGWSTHNCPKQARALFRANDLFHILATKLSQQGNEGFFNQNPIDKALEFRQSQSLPKDQEWVFSEIM